MATVVFNGEQLDAAVGETLFAMADRSTQGSCEIASSCARAGTCRECIVQVKAGHEGLTPPSPEERFLEGRGDADRTVFRLACRARVRRDDARIEVETFKRRLDIAVTGRSAGVALEPWTVRRNGAIYGRGQRLVDHSGPVYGLAVDVGTTTVVMHVIDLESGQTAALQAFENPQKFGGSDVMHRISYDAAHRGQLHRTIVGHLNNALRSMPQVASCIFAVTVAGNATMRDLVFDLDVQSIGQSPYLSITQKEMIAGRRASTAEWAVARELGLAVHPRALVYGLPLVSNHVGADMAAVLATIPIHEHDRPFVVVDIGTNTEVVVGDRERIICASCPAGPAFEGGRLSCGMPAADGAITHLRRRGDSWQIESIGSTAVRGICGSGLVDILAELLASGEMDELGRFRDGGKAIPVCERPAVALTRSDASELAQAKAANAVGQYALLRQFGIRPSDVGTYYLAGAFANKIDLENARRIGLLLPIPDDRIVRIGNAAIEGAKAALINEACLHRIEALVGSVTHVELEKEPDFFELFVEMTQFKPIADVEP